WPCDHGRSARRRSCRRCRSGAGPALSWAQASNHREKSMNEVVIAAGARTAIGDFGGGLKDVAPCELGATVIREALQRCGVAGEEVGNVAMGHVINTAPRDMYLSRVAAVNAGVSHGTPAFNVNRLCGSGLQAIVSAAQTIMLGDA